MAVQIKLMGVAVIPPQKWAVLQIQAPGKKPVPVTLGEGAREASLEVLEIDPLGRQVKVRYSSVVMTLMIGSDSAKSGDGLATLASADKDHVPLSTIPLPEAGDP